jgi:hypothetical protein
MEFQGDSTNPPVAASLKATYRALLARGLEIGEAANLTAYLHGLPSGGFRWTLPEVEAILRRRLQHAADLRAARTSPMPAPAQRERSTIRDRWSPRSGTTDVIDPPQT